MGKSKKAKKEDKKLQKLQKKRDGLDKKIQKRSKKTLDKNLTERLVHLLESIEVSSCEE